MSLAAVTSGISTKKVDLRTVRFIAVSRKSAPHLDPIMNGSVEVTATMAVPPPAGSPNDIVWAAGGSQFVGSEVREDSWRHPERIAVPGHLVVNTPNRRDR